MSRRSGILILVIAGFIGAAAALTIYGLSGSRINYIPTGSMMNTIIPGDRVIVRRFSSEVKRGQVVVYQYPGDNNYYMGRVIGLPNETLEMRGTSVYVNQNLRVNEIRVMAESTDEYGELKELSTDGVGRYKVYYELGLTRVVDESELGPHQIPAGHYFMMGDNRDNSEDSRHRGSVPRELIWGEIYKVCYSTHRISGEFRWDRLFKNIQ